MLRHLFATLLAALVVAAVTRAVEDEQAATPADQIRQLIPGAAAMRTADFKRMATSPTTPKASDFEDKSLTLMFWTIPHVADADEETREEFEFVTERIPRPSDLAREMWRTVGAGGVRIQTGPVTAIHAERITKMHCKVEGDRATGTVHFEVPDLYRGKVDFVARQHDGKWRIEEFSMPARKIHIVRDEQGTWREKTSRTDGD